MTAGHAPLVAMIAGDIANNTLVIPSMPTSLQKLQVLRSDDKCTVGDVAKIIQADPALGGKIMAFANSPFIRPPNPISNFESAIAWMGVPYSISLAYGAAVISTFTATEPVLNTLTSQVWRIAGLSSHAAGILAQTLGKKAFAEEILVALFSNVGALSLIHHINKTQEYRERSAQSEMIHVLSEFNGQVTEMVTRAWLLPADIVSKIRSVLSDATTEDEMVLLVRSAIGFALTESSAPFPYPEKCSFRELERIVIDESERQSVIDQVVERIAEEPLIF